MTGYKPKYLVVSWHREPDDEDGIDELECEWGTDWFVVAWSIAAREWVCALFLGLDGEVRVFKRQPGGGA